MNDKRELLIGALPFYNILSDEDKERIDHSCISKSYNKGAILLSDNECRGLIVVVSGQLRVYTVSEEGKEITLYRLLEGDTCIMSASCMLKDINFNLSMTFEQDSKIIIIPTYVYDSINKEYAEAKNFTLDLVSGRFSDVMWILQQYVFLGMARRLANAIIEQSNLNSSMSINITHEELSKELGSAREVITRLLKQFVLDGLIKLSRNKIHIIDIEGLYKI